VAYCHVVCIKVKVRNDLAEGPHCLFGAPNHRDLEWVADILDVPREFLLVEVNVVNRE